MISFSQIFSNVNLKISPSAIILFIPAIAIWMLPGSIPLETNIKSRHEGASSVNLYYQQFASQHLVNTSVFKAPPESSNLTGIITSPGFVVSTLLISSEPLDAMVLESPAPQSRLASLYK